MKPSSAPPWTLSRMFECSRSRDHRHARDIVLEPDQQRFEERIEPGRVAEAASASTGPLRVDRR